MQFRPGWKLSLFFILMLPCLLTLGFWQLQRAQEKQQILDLVAERRSAAPMDMSQLLALEDPAYSQVKLRGSYLQDRLILLDNQVYQGRFGYEVVMPFRTAGGELLLLSRGWVPGSLRREQLPVLEPVTGTVELVAEVYVPLGEAYTLEDTALPQGWPKRVQGVDGQALSQALSEQLYPYVMRLRAGSATVLQGHWQDVNILPQKHTAYGVQWFAMAAALVILYLSVAFGFLKSKRMVED